MYLLVNMNECVYGTFRSFYLYKSKMLIDINHSSITCLFFCGPILVYKKMKNIRSECILGSNIDQCPRKLSSDFYQYTIVINSIMFIRYLIALHFIFAMVSARSLYMKRKTTSSKTIDPPPNIDQPKKLPNTINYETLGNFSHSSSILLLSFFRWWFRG